ncbi:MAG: hypothetical protein LBL04_11280 [Bacteroidales bacterium]|nr:hypothetical protein [Bacteroidales bacterium]
MEDQILEFNENWNGKLNCKAFTTLRLRNDRKFYKGARFQVYLKKVYKGTATVKSVSILTLDRINDFIAWLDTGYSAEECRDIILTMYKGRGLFTKENEKRQELSFVLLVYEAKKEMNDLFDTNK